MCIPSGAETNILAEQKITMTDDKLLGPVSI